MDSPQLGQQHEHERRRRSSSAHAKEDETNNAVVERMQSLGIKCVVWTGKCEANQVTVGRYDVPDGQSGMYGLLFDNTFSKAVSKTATFVLMTHPTSVPPKLGAQLRHQPSQNQNASPTDTGRPLSTLGTHASSESLVPDCKSVISSREARRSPSIGSFTNGFYNGIMHKKRRKKGQGYASRFFSLDFTSATLSYYRNSHASALRGSIPLSLASIGVSEGRKEFTIDSGAELWHLRLRNKKDFDNWRRAFEQATHQPVQEGTDDSKGGLGSNLMVNGGQGGSGMEELDWNRVQQLVSKVSGSRDAVRGLARDTDPQYPNRPIRASLGDANSYIQNVLEKDVQKLPFWKRKLSSSSQQTNPTSMFKRSFSAQGTVTNSSMSENLLSPASAMGSPPAVRNVMIEEIHERCTALLGDLDATVQEFAALIKEAKGRRRLVSSASRVSMQSALTAGETFYDAEEIVPSQILDIQHADSGSEHDDFYSDDESVSDSDEERDHPRTTSNPKQTAGDSRFPLPPSNRSPKEIPSFNGRTTIQPPKQPPPSLISFFRKNAGKDLSTIAMPVTANEPTSLLQRLAERFENVKLLTCAASSSSPDQIIERLVYISAFAVATMASNRVKERAVRKPFNPMLGETFELIRHEDLNDSRPLYRFIAEKVTHHPVKMAYQVDALDGSWSLAQSACPTQKFWGKSMEINTEGKYRLVLHKVVQNDLSERYSWSQPTAYLRNMIAGEKYIEPVGNMTVTNESTGHKATVTFKAGGMFAGRSEDVNIAFFEPSSSSAINLSVTGKWTTSLVRSDTNEEIWKAGPLVNDASKVWGFPVFTAQLNDLTAVEKDKIPQTDTRLRPDQKALEDGQLDQAESMKARLEERQRARRKVLEEHGATYKARFFEKVEVKDPDTNIVEEIWELKTGKEGYWEQREAGSWNDVPNVFET